jgi:hypothetical protein
LQQQQQPQQRHQQQLALLIKQHLSCCSAAPSPASPSRAAPMPCRQGGSRATAQLTSCSCRARRGATSLHGCGGHALRAAAC